MSTEHSNEFIFSEQFGIKISFKYDGDYIVTDGQKLTSVTSSKGKITIEAGRLGSSRCVNWYDAYVNGAESHMIHTEGGIINRIS